MITQHSVKKTIPALALVTAAMLGACSDSTSVSGGAATIQIVSGDSQTAVVATAFASPLVVVVEDSDSKPVPGVQVKFLTSDSGSFSAATATTDATGQASTTFTPGKRAGSVVVSASVPGILSAAFDLTVAAAAPSNLSKVSGDNQTASAGATLGTPFVIQAIDGFGNPVPGVPVTWTTSAGSFATADGVTDANGEAKAQLTLGGSPGSETVTAHIGGSTTDVTFTVTAQ